MKTDGEMRNYLHFNHLFFIPCVARLMGYFFSSTPLLIFFLFLPSALTNFGGFKQNLMTKAFSGRFGFDSLELRKLKRSVKNKAAGTPHVMIIHFRIYHLAWGFQRCSFRLTGQCEGLNEWNGHQNWLHVFFILKFFWLKEPNHFIG